MNGELLSVLDFMEREKGINKEVLIEAVEASLVSASRKAFGNAKNVAIKIDRTTGDIKAFSELTVVKKIEDPTAEIALKEAKKIDPDAAPGDVIRKEVTPKNFGRIAAQTAKQVIIQKIREAEREIVYTEYKDKVGDLATGTVRRVEHGNVILDLGKTEAVLPYRERCPKEDYEIGERFSVYINEVKIGQKGPEIIVSRTNPGLVIKLFELEVPEILEGTVKIKKVAREPGYRAKIAIISTDDKVDCVGACVGMRGARVKNVVRELNGEKIDIVKWDEDVGIYVTNSLSPAELKKVEVLEKEKTVKVLVNEDQLALAIGKRGQNARLTAKLTGWKIDIQKELGMQSLKEMAIKQFLQIDGLEEEGAKALVNAGYTSLESLSETKPADLEELEGLDKAKIKKILATAKKGVPLDEVELDSAVFEPEKPSKKEEEK